MPAYQAAHQNLSTLSVFRASIICLSWQGLLTTIAEELGCYPKTVRKRLHRFNAEGIDGLGDCPGAGRKPRITEGQLFPQ